MTTHKHINTIILEKKLELVIGLFYNNPVDWDVFPALMLDKV